MRKYSQALAMFLVSLALIASSGCAPIIKAQKWVTGQNMVEASRDVTVEIRLYGPNGPVGVGTGFVVDRRGLVVTNHHVTSAQALDEKHKPIVIKQIYVCANASLGLPACAEAKVLASSPRDDLALLQVARTFPFTTSIGPPRVLEDGEEVFARATIGQLVGPSLVHGRYVGMSRMDEIAVLDRPYVVLDIALNPGGSGGPVFDRKNGNLIGVFVAIASYGGQPMALAIPVATVIEFLKEHDPYLQPPKGE